MYIKYLVSTLSLNKPKASLRILALSAFLLAPAAVCQAQLRIYVATNGDDLADTESSRLRVAKYTFPIPLWPSTRTATASRRSETA